MEKEEEEEEEEANVSNRNCSKFVFVFLCPGFHVETCLSHVCGHRSLNEFKKVGFNYFRLVNLFVNTFQCLLFECRSIMKNYKEIMKDLRPANSKKTEKLSKQTH